MNHRPPRYEDANIVVKTAPLWILAIILWLFVFSV